MPQPEPHIAQHPFNPGHFSCKTAHGHQQYCAKQGLDEQPLPFGFTTANDGREIDR